MLERPRLAPSLRGLHCPLKGSAAPILGAVALCAGLSVGCGDQEQESSLPLLHVGMTPAVAPIYDDGETRIYEVKRGIQFPVLAPSDVTRGELDRLDIAPYGRRPWITVDDVQVQVTWTLSNLDEDDHVVEVLVDPWNEFGRYYPGLQLTDADNQEFMPNFSGIDKRYIVAGKGQGENSRVHGIYTFADLQEVATDLATVMGIIATPPPPEPDAEEGEDPRVTYANHAFHWQNRSYNDLLVATWIPTTVAGLTGLDIGFRTQEPATLALEVVVEVVDKGGERLRPDGDDAPLLPPTEEIITVGSAPP